MIKTDFDKAINILEKKLEARNSSSYDGLTSNNRERRNIHRQSSNQFNIQPKEDEEGAMIDPSQLITTHSGRKSSFINKPTSASRSGKHGSNISASSGSHGGSVEAGRSSSQQGGGAGFPTGANVPASYYREIEEQLADALFKRCQAKLMADPDQANVETALADGLKVCTYRYTTQ